MMRMASGAEWRRWFLRGWPLWWSLVFACGGLAVWCLWPHADTIRRTGLFYECVGILAVGVQFWNAMRDHGVGSPWVRGWQYLKSFPVRGPVRVFVMPAGGSFRLTGHAPIVAQGPAKPTIDERLVAIEGRLSALDSRSQSFENDMRMKLGMLIDALAAEAELRESAIKETARAIQVGDLKLSLFGLMWLFIGALMTTGAPEVCALLSCVS